MKQRPTIDHNPHERRPTNTIWWVALAIIIALWVWTLTGDAPVQWQNIMLGLGTGGLLAIWAIEITGNKVPESWTRKRRD